MPSPTLTTETRTYVGEKSSAPGTGYAGYVVGQRYKLRLHRPGDGTVNLAAIPLAGTRAITVSEGLFERWWRL